MVSDLKTGGHKGCKIATAKKVFFTVFFLHLFTPFKIFLPPLHEVQWFLKSVGKSNGKKWYQIWKLLLIKYVKSPRKTKFVFLANLALQAGFFLLLVLLSALVKIFFICRMQDFLNCEYKYEYYSQGIFTNIFKYLNICYTMEPICRCRRHNIAAGAMIWLKEPIFCCRILKKNIKVVFPLLCQDLSFSPIYSLSEPLLPATFLLAVKLYFSDPWWWVTLLCQLVTRALDPGSWPCLQAPASKLVTRALAPSSWLLAPGSKLLAPSSWIQAPGSWFQVPGS